MTLVALGGDGTINDILNGIEPFAFSYLRLHPLRFRQRFCPGSFPSLHSGPGPGSGPSSENLRLREHRTDFPGRTHPFLGVSAGMGYDASVCSACGRSALKTCLNTFRAGKLVYLFSGIKLLFTQKLVPLTVTTEEYGLCFSQGILCRRDESSLRGRRLLLLSKSGSGGRNAGIFACWIRCPESAPSFFCPWLCLGNTAIKKEYRSFAAARRSSGLLYPSASIRTASALVWKNSFPSLCFPKS